MTLRGLPESLYKIFVFLFSVSKDALAHKREEFLTLLFYEPGANQPDLQILLLNINVNIKVTYVETVTYLPDTPYNHD